MTARSLLALIGLLAALCVLVIVVASGLTTGLLLGARALLRSAERWRTERAERAAAKRWARARRVGR